jgi:hypothetical protein
MFDLETLRSRLRLDASGFTGPLDGAQRALTGFSQRMAHAGGGVLGLGRDLGLATIGLQGLASGARGAFGALFGGNVAIENVRAQLLAFTKSGEQADKILADIRSEAAKTPFAFNEMAAATASLLPASKQSGVALMDLVKQAEILAAVNPAEGLEGAAFALREALSGDFTSIIERFNLPRQRLNELKEQGVPAMEAISIAMKEMGIDASIVSNMANTATGRWSTFVDTLNTIKDTALRRTFELLSGALVPLQAWLDANNERLTELAELAGERLAAGLRRFGRWLLRIVRAVKTGVEAFRDLRSKGVDPLRAAFMAFRQVVTRGDDPTGLSRFSDQVERVVAVITRLAPVIWRLAIGTFRTLTTIVGVLVKHLDLVAPVVVGLTTSFLLFYKVIPAIQAARAALIALRVSLLAVSPWFLVIAGAGALFALAYETNWLGIRDITNKAVGWIVKQFRRFVAILKGGKGLHGAIADLPKPLQKLAIAARRVVVLFDDLLHGRWGELQRDWEMLGRTFGNLFKSIGLERFGTEIKRTFRDVASLIAHVVDLVDDLVHGRWREVWGDLGRIAVDLFHLFVDRFRLAIALVRDLFDLIPWGKVGNALWNGLKGAVRFMVETDLPWLVVQGARLFKAVRDGMTEFWADKVRPWLGDRVAAIVKAIATRFRLIYNTGRDIISQLWTGMASLANWLFNQVWDLIQRCVVNPAMAFYNSMWFAGRYVMEGFIDGFKSKFEGLIAAAQLAKNLIEQYKGPIEKDKVLLRPHGRAIMGGLIASMMGEMPALQRAMGEVTRAIAAGGAMSFGAQRLSPVAESAVAGGAGGIREIHHHHNWGRGAIQVDGTGRNAKAVARQVAAIWNAKLDLIDLGMAEE